MTVQYLIDSENVGDFWIPLLDLPADETELIVFYTRNSPHMSYESLIKLKESDRTVTFIKCYEGTNALDFQLVSELGYRIGNDEDGRFVIVTNDTGFDAAVKYWRRRKKSVKRVTGRECRNLVRRLREDLSIGLHDGQHSHSLDVSDHLDMDTDHSKEQDVHDEAIHTESAEANEVRSSGPNLRDAERAAQPDAEESFSEAESEYMMDAEIDEADGDDADEFAYDREAEESEADAFDDDADEDEEELDDIRAQESGRDAIEDTEEEIRVSDEAVSEDESAIEDPVTDDGTVPVQDDEHYDASGEDEAVSDSLDTQEKPVQDAGLPDAEDSPEGLDAEEEQAVQAAVNDTVPETPASESEETAKEASTETPEGTQDAEGHEALLDPSWFGTEEDENDPDDRSGDDAGHHSKSRRSRSRKSRTTAKKQEQAADSGENDHTEASTEGKKSRTSRKNASSSNNKKKPGRNDDAVKETPEAEKETSSAEISVPGDDEIAKIVSCIGVDNLAELHNQLATFYGDQGKEIYLSIKNNNRSIPVLKPDLRQKFEYYCEIIFSRSDYEGEYPSDLSEYLISVREKLNNLNSLRYALQKHYGKEKGRRFYFLLKPFAKTMYQM